MKVFVSGGAGFIGSNFIRRVLRSRPEWTVINYDNLSYAGKATNLSSIEANPNYHFIRGDICDGKAVLSALRGCDAVVHFAAESHVDRSIYEPDVTIRTNVAGTCVLLDVARKCDVRRFVHVSTDEVYGDMWPTGCADEDSPLSPSSPYSASKASSDLVVKSYIKSYGFPAVITRSSNNYGPCQLPEKFVPLTIVQALNDKPIPVYGDGKQQREWIFVDDNCRAILTVLEKGRLGEVYNIGSSCVQENIEMARNVLRLLSKTEDLLLSVTDRPGHDRRYAMDSRKIQAELGWWPRVKLTEGLRVTVEWYRTNAAWISQVLGGDYRSYCNHHYRDRVPSLSSIAYATAAATK